MQQERVHAANLGALGGGSHAAEGHGMTKVECGAGKGVGLADWEVGVVVGARATTTSKHGRIMPRSVVAMIGNFSQLHQI